MWNNGAKNSIASKFAECAPDIAQRVNINATHESAKEVDRLLKPTNPLPQTIRQSRAAAIGQSRLHDTNAVDRLKRPKAIAAQRSGAALGFTRPAIRALCSICEERVTELRDKAVTHLSRFNACFDGAKRTDGPSVHLPFARNY